MEARGRGKLGGITSPGQRGVLTVLETRSQRRPATAVPRAGGVGRDATWTVGRATVWGSDQAQTRPLGFPPVGSLTRLPGRTGRG